MSAYTFKNCPFCASDDIGTAIDENIRQSNWTDYWFSYCAECGCRGPMARSEDEAVRYWNAREEIEK